MASDIIFLPAAKLRVLAERIHLIERTNLADIQFASTTEEVVYLRISNSNLQSVGSILDASDAAVTKYASDAVRRPIASLIFAYTETCLNNALQIFNNYTVRKDNLDKITTHLQNLIKELDDLDTSNSADVTALTEKIEKFNEAITNYTKMTANTRASEDFSRRLKDSGIDFPTLVRRYQANLGFSGQFEKLTDEQKILVYDSIIEASGRGKVLTHKVLKAISVPGSFRSNQLKDITIEDAFGKAVLLKNAAVITWDVFTAEHPIKAVTRDAIVIAANKGGALLGDIVSAAMVTLEVAEASALFVTGVGFVVGFAAGFIVGQIAGAVFDAIFGSGGSDPLPNQDQLFYAATMPDGKELARLIA
ncbi:uncharacterized protein LOC107416216 [Ziziphus jujuba]|uniref:Uncharacterized protein LOC107416216 n=1 Tax=Ziziphus jujuba TaxID=326968 RepID=A0ABM4A606_ZIZJJ|nr:uncharacterized protein LOC107416216 [Ziziphus jujuba]